jgi:hypothetical protein
MNKEFDDVARIYLPTTCKPLDIEECTYRGCKMWIFRRVVRKWRPSLEGMNSYRVKKIPYNDIPENQREYYNDEFWMGISDYFTKYGCEFENQVSTEIGESMNREEAKYRLENYIDENYAEFLSTEIIP